MAMLKRALLLAFIAWTVDCTKSTPLSSSNNQVVSLAITGPASVAPGTSAQLTATAVRAGSNGAEDVTAQATWMSSDPTVLQVNGGRVDAVGDGEAVVAALYSAVRTMKTIDVFEPGTFTITGSVSDGYNPINGARIDVVSGTGAGRFATTSGYGSFRLFGLLGSVDLRASADGYVSTSQTANVTSNTNLQFGLTPIIAPADASGAWQLTIDASRSCTTLVNAARHRTYTAAITQRITGLSVALSGAVFALHSYGGSENEFYGHVTQSSVTLNLQPDFYYGDDYDLAEVLPDGGGVYSAIGTGSGTLTGGTIVATLQGTISITNPSTGPSIPTACVAADHVMTFVRAQSTTGRR
jgi:hypothetical protein